MRRVPTAQHASAATSSPYGPMAVIADPSAGGGSVARRLDEVRAALDGSGLAYRLEIAPKPGDVEALARAAFDDGYRFVVAVGDDRTVQEVVNGAFRDGTPIAEAPVLGVVPAGGGCDLVRSFGLPDDPAGAVSHLAGDATYALDLMKVTSTEASGDRRTRYGHNVVQIGLRAAVATRTARLAPGGARLRRFATFWGTYARWRHAGVTVANDTRTHELRAWDLAVANGQFVDGGMRLSPRSYPGDGVLDSLVFTGPKADAYRMLPRIFMNGGHLPDPGVKELRSKIRVAVKSDRALPVVLDGRPFGRTPVTVQVVPQQVLLKL